MLTMLPVSVCFKQKQGSLLISAFICDHFCSSSILLWLSVERSRCPGSLKVRNLGRLLFFELWFYCFPTGGLMVYHGIFCS